MATNPDPQNLQLNLLTQQLVTGEIDRRTFVLRGVALAVSLPILGAIVAACSPASTASPSGSESIGAGSSKKPLIGFLLRDIQQVRWNFDAKGFAAEAETLMVPYIIQFTADGTQASQNANAETMIAQGIKALVVVPVGSDTVGGIIKACHDAGVKYISYGNEIPGVDFILDRDNPGVGEIFAKHATAFAPSGNYVLIYGEQGNDVAEAKKTGIWTVLKPLVDSGAIKVVSEKYTKGWDPQLAQAQVEAALAATNNNIQAIVASNDGMGLGAFTPIQAAGLQSKVFISGEDGDLARVQLIAEGLPQVTTWEPYPTQGATAADVAVALATGKDPHATSQTTLNGVAIPTIQFKTIALTKDTIFDQLVKTGFYSYSDVYKLTPVNQRPPSPAP